MKKTDSKNIVKKQTRLNSRKWAEQKLGIEEGGGEIGERGFEREGEEWRKRGQFGWCVV